MNRAYLEQSTNVFRNTFTLSITTFVYNATCSTSPLYLIESFISDTSNHLGRNNLRVRTIKVINTKISTPSLISVVKQTFLLLGCQINFVSTNFRPPKFKTYNTINSLILRILLLTNLQLIIICVLQLFSIVTYVRLCRRLMSLH